jgi:Mg-chelatase subunit ChlD
MVFVVDGSGSMRDGIAGAPSRMAAAKSSINRVVKSLHKDIRIGMVSFSDCGATRNSRYYSAAERGQLLGRIDAIRPGRRTSLAASIRRAGALATRRAETVIVVVSDGEDTCGSDPCAAARSIRGRKPNLKINVIDLSGGTSAAVLQCIARAGGGRVFTPNSAGQMTSQLQQATGQPDASRC